MNLNFNYYNKDIIYNRSQEEDKIIEYILNNTPENYENIIENDSTDEVILALSTIRNNIVCAYDFNPNSNILEIGAHLGEVTGALCQTAKKVVAIESVKRRAEAISKRCVDVENLEIIVGNLKDIPLEEKFDYITLFGILEYAQKFFNTENPVQDLLFYCKKLLKDNGKILIATNNKFALKSFVGDIDECTNNTFDSITGYRNSKKQFKLSKNEIENILKKVGLKYYKFLYPLPDYKLPNIIFSDDYLPTSSKINAYFPYYRDNSSIFFSEVDAYDTIINSDKNMFKFFANSYLIEISQMDFANDIKYISFNNYRKKNYRLMTKIKTDYVEKIPTNSFSVEHIREMEKIIQHMNNDGIKTLDKYEDKKVVSKFVNEKLLSQKISDNLENIDYIYNLLQKYKDEIYRLSYNYSEDEKNVFDKYSIKVEKKVLKKFRYLKHGYWDMIFKNCFLLNDEFVFFDQEWIEENIPAEFLIYRCIVNIEKLRDKIDEYGIFEKIGIKNYINLFEELDNNISERIFDRKIFELYTRKHSNPIYDIGKIEEELNYERKKSTELEKSINNLSNEIYAKNEEIEKLKNQLNQIYQSKSWKTIKKIKKIFNI